MRALLGGLCGALLTLAHPNPALSAGASAPPNAGATPVQDPVPPPADRSAEGLRRWVAENIHAAGYTLASTTRDYALFVGTEGMEKAPGGTVVTLLRIEHFVPAEGQATHRSFTQRTEFDCAAKRSRALNNTYYAGSNLEGGVVLKVDETTPWDRVRRNSVAGDILAQVCMLAGQREVVLRGQPPS